MIPRNAPIKNYMVAATVHIDADLPLSDARDRMANESVRHLPVKDGDRLIGILSARDILLMESLSDADPAQTPVGSAMGGSLKTIDVDSTLGDVLGMMTEEGIGAVPIVENDQLVGIFTTVDAAKLLLKALV